MTIAGAVTTHDARTPKRTAPNPYVFVVGCQRSGTTMLQRILDAHPRLTVAYDSLFIPSVVRDEPVGADPRLTDRVIETVRTHPRFARLGLPDDAVARAAVGTTRFSKYVRKLYDELAKMHGKRLAGEKSPGYCRHIPHLHGLFPQARFVHLIRDGGEIALSIRDWGRGAAKLDLAEREPIAAAALWWRRDVTLGCRDGQPLGPALYTEVRYERLISETEATVRELAQFLDLPYAPEMLEYHKGKLRDEPGLSAKKAWLPPTPGVRDWRTQLSERDRELFEAIAGEQLAALGYERTCPRVSPGIAERARECEAWWTEQMH